jgi:hypothetical protein
MMQSASPPLSIETAMDKLLRRKKKTVTPDEKMQIEQVAEKMIRAATMNDVRQYDTAYHRLAAAVKRAPAKYKVAAYKKAAPKKAWGVKKTAAKRVGRKKAAPKKSVATKR